MPPTPAQLHGSPLRLPHQGARNNVLTRSDNMPAREIQPRLRVQNIGDLRRSWDVSASPSTGQRPVWPDLRLVKADLARLPPGEHVEEAAQRPAVRRMQTAENLAAALRSRGHPREEDLHTVCIRSASLLHTRELRCWVTRGQGPLGEIAAWFNCGMPGAFLPTRAFVQTLPVTLNGVRRVSRGWGRAASDGLNQLTSLESALRHRALSTWVPDDRLPITLRAMTAPPDQSTQGAHASAEPRHSVSGGTIFRRDKR
jgi:hypothetical protein